MEFNKGPRVAGEALANPPFEFTPPRMDAEAMAGFEKLDELAGAHPAPEPDALWDEWLAQSMLEESDYKNVPIPKYLFLSFTAFVRKRAAHPESRGASLSPHSSVIHTGLTVRCHGCGGTMIWRYFEENDEIEIFHGPNCATTPPPPGAPEEQKK